MKKKRAFINKMLYAISASIVLVMSSCNKELVPDVFIKATESDIILEYTGLTHTGQPASFELGSNESWSVVSAPLWLHVNHRDGSRGRIQFYIRAEENRTGEDRQGFIEFESESGKPEQISVLQKHLEATLALSVYDITANILGLGATNQTIAFTLTSNYPWQITLPNECDWVTLSKQTGEAGTSSIELTIQPNSTGIKRSVLLTCKAGKTERILSLAQEAKALEISNKKIFLNSFGTLTTDGNAATISINALESWEVEEKPQWVQCSPSAGMAGNTTMTFTANNSDEQREGLVVLRSLHLSKDTISIVQMGKPQLTADNKPVGHVYFNENFDWANAIATQYPDICQDQVGSVNGSKGKTIPIYSNETVKTFFDNTLEDANPNGKCIYVADGYLKLGKSKTQTGVIPKNALDIPEGNMANVELTFDIAKNGTDNVTITVEIEGDGQIVDGETPLMSKPIVPINNNETDKPWQWKRDQGVRINGVTARTRVIIRSTQYNSTAGYYRWFLDNIKITRITTN